MSGPAANAQWYLARDGEQFGPISDAEMARFVELGHLKPTDLLWREGFPDWRPALLVFPPRGRAMPADPRMMHPEPRGPMGSPRMMAEPFAAPGPGHRAGYMEEERHRPGIVARVGRLLLMVAVMAGAAGAAYVYRAQLKDLIVSYSQSAARPVTDTRSLELPPLAGFRAGSAEAVDATLQATALWKLIKREFPDWYKERVAEAVQMAQEGKDDAVIAQFVARKLADLRRQQAATALFATRERLKTVAVAYSDAIKHLRAYSIDACAGFIRRGEAEPLIVALLQEPSEHTARLQAYLTAIFEAVAEGRQLPRVHPRPTPEHQQLLEAELTKRGWTNGDFKMLFGNQGLAQAPPEKVCQLVDDFYESQLAVPDQEAQMHLLTNFLRPILVAG